MIISHKYKFIFIKTTKTAGTSLEIFFSTVCDEEDICTPIIPYVEPHVARNYKDKAFYNHISGNEIRELVTKKIWDSYYKFCFERNPWDKVISFYHMLKKIQESEVSLEEYVNSQKFPVDSNKYLSKHGEIIVDDVFKFESLEEDLSKICDRLHIPFSGKLDFAAKSEYRDDHRHYRDVLTSEQAKIISKKFDKEIELFGYKY